jgi:hypothetical protein
MYPHIQLFQDHQIDEETLPQDIQDDLGDFDASMVAKNHLLKQDENANTSEIEKELLRISKTIYADTQKIINEKAAQEAEAKRIAEEAEAKRIAEEAEAKRIAEEAEAKRIADEAEAEAKRIADEEAQRTAAKAKRIAAQEAQLAADEAEAKRIADEEAQRTAAEAQRIASETKKKKQGFGFFNWWS